MASLDDTNLITLSVQFDLTNGQTNETIAKSPELGNYQQLERDSNSELNARYYQNIDGFKWSAVADEIGSLVNDAQLEGLSSEEVSLIYGRIMIIITAQYLPIISDFLGDEIAQQAATENIASDISAFLADGQDGVNALASTSTTTTENEEKLFSGVMSLIGAVSGADNTIVYDYSFTVYYSQFDVTTGTIVTGFEVVSSVLDFLTNDAIWKWGTDSVTPLSTDAASTISTALSDIPSIYNANLNPDEEDDNSWYDMDLTEIASKTLTWTEPYGATSLLPASEGGIGPEDAPLVYTQPNTIQQDFNQSTQTVQTVATATQTTQNFQVQEIDQYYGIINSIQQSQQQQCSSMVKKQVV